MEFLPDELLQLLLLSADWQTLKRLCISTNKIHRLCNKDIWLSKILSIAPQRNISSDIPLSRLLTLGDIIGNSGTGYYFARGPLSILPPPFITKPVCQVSCADDMIAWVTTNGEVYVQGGNPFGSLGLGELSSVHQPTRISGLTNVIQVDCCGIHTSFYYPMEPSILLVTVNIFMLVLGFPPLSQ